MHADNYEPAGTEPSLPVDLLANPGPACHECYIVIQVHQLNSMPALGNVHMI
jgi:hypothetical protein